MSDKDFDSYLDKKRPIAKTFLDQFDSNAWITLNRYSNDLQDLSERLDWRFGSIATGDQVPILLRHSIGKAGSSFPGVYLRGTYPIESDTFRITNGNVSPDQEHMLINKLPDRRFWKNTPSLV